MDSEPEDRSGADSRSGEGSSADDFEAIVAKLRQEGTLPEWPDEVTGPPDGSVPPDDREPTAGVPDVGPRPGADEPHGAPPETSPAVPPPPYDEEHFIPPEPPPLPRIGPPAAVGLTLLALGVLLCVAPSVIGVPESYGIPLGLLALAAGLGWLVLRLWPTPPPRGTGDDGDDGAVL